MNFIRNFFIFIACILSFAVSAEEQCTFNAESDFEFTVSLTASELSNTVEIDAVNPNANDFPLNSGNPVWANKKSSNAAITDTKLKSNTNYTLGFSFKFSSGSGSQAVDGRLTYYRKAEGQDWEEVTTDKFIRISKSTKFMINHGELNCDGSPTEVTPDPVPDDFDVCDYFPGAMQTNYYVGGTPYGTLRSTQAATITVPNDDYVMSFFAYQGFNECHYPSSPAEGSPCKVSPVAIDGYPLVLSDEFTGDNLTIPTNTTHTLDSGEYWFDTLTFGGANAKLAINGQVIVHYKNFVVPNSGYETNFYINEGGNVKDLVMVGHGSKSSIIIEPDVSASMQAVGNFYIDPQAGGFSLAGVGSSITGSISANNVAISGNVTLNTAGTCIDPNPPTGSDETYTLEVTPDNQFALLCENPEVTFTVYDEDGSVATDYDGTITASYPDGLTPLEPTTGNKENDYVYTPDNGKVKVPVETNTLGEYTVQATLTDDTNIYDSGSVLFGPYKFDIEPVKAVAAHPTSFSVKVLACENDQVTTVKGYQGDKTLDVSNIELTKPTISEGAKDGNLKLSNSENGNYSSSNVTLAFSENATASGYLTYQEAGSLNFTLTDPEFECPEEYDGCEVSNEEEGSENITSLEGVANVDVRPWTFAICDRNDKDMSGTSEGGSAFIAAGDPFTLEIKPIVWQNGGSIADGDQIDVTNLCRADVTENFFIEEAPIATVEVGSELATPENGRLGSGIESVDGLTREHDQDSDEKFIYSNLKWQEVGSLKLTADTIADYLEMDINLGYRNIGRFYPHHLSHQSNDWNYADGHSGFAYMNQPISSDYIVEARSEADLVTWNYGLFNSALQDELALSAIRSDNSQSLLSRLVYTGQSSNGWSDELSGGTVSERNGQYQVNYYDFEFLKKVGSNPNTSDYTSTPDGPYDSTNALFGVAVTKKVDDVDFNFDEVDPDKIIDLDINTDGSTDKGVAFNSQPDFRYGRMTLDSVSGSSGELVKVPLRTEYWDGDSYIQNSDDSGSQFITSQHCVLSDIANSDAYLTDTNANTNRQTVGSGSSGIVRAGQMTSQREIARIFLRQGITEPHGTECNWSVGDQPWLQFNWRDYGDEDPSTVIVFGAYRGNDRVIYRGEPNLTAN